MLTPSLFCCGTNGMTTWISQPSHPTPCFSYHRPQEPWVCTTSAGGSGGSKRDTRHVTAVRGVARRNQGSKRVGVLPLSSSPGDASPAESARVGGLNDGGRVGGWGWGEMFQVPTTLATCCQILGVDLPISPPLARVNKGSELARGNAPVQTGTLLSTFSCDVARACLRTSTRRSLTNQARAASRTVLGAGVTRGS